MVRKPEIGEAMSCATPRQKLRLPLATLRARDDVVYLDAWPEHYASYRNRSVDVALSFRNPLPMSAGDAIVVAHQIGRQELTRGSAIDLFFHYRRGFATGGRLPRLDPTHRREDFVMAVWPCQY